jgi:hypothetical protein
MERVTKSSKRIQEEENVDKGNVQDDSDVDIDAMESDDDEYLTGIINRDKFKQKKRKVTAAVGSKKKKSAIEEDVVGASDTALDVDYMDSSASTEKMETGHVIRIYVEDFMCHRKLTLDFGRHVNFVTGQNGSGKCSSNNLLRLQL